MASDRDDHDRHHKEDKKNIQAAFDAIAKSKPSNITSMNDAACALSSCLNKALYFDYIYSGDRTLIGVYRVNDDVWFKLPTSAISEDHLYHEKCIKGKFTKTANSP